MVLTDQFLFYIVIITIFIQNIAHFERHGDGKNFIAHYCNYKNRTMRHKGI